jgi:type IV pilus assembly protein PilW
MKTTSQGFSLVEILVAMVISLLGTLIIFQVFEVSEGIKRTTTTGGDAQQSGLLALVALERDARMAGFGINYPPLLGCQVVGKDVTRDINFTLAAASVGDEVSAAGDAVTFVYGSNGLLLAPPKLVSAAGTSASYFKVDNRYGFELNDMLIVGQAGKKCSLAQATVLSTATGQKDEVQRTGGDYNGAALADSYDPWDNTSQAGGRLMSLGANPAATTYVVDSGTYQLVATNNITGASSDVVAEGIVMLQAEYGKDTSPTPDGVVDVWEAKTPGTGDEWSRVLALRMALVARSALPERPTDGIQCPQINDPTDPAKPLTDATKKFKWAGGGIDLSYLSTAETDWTCYRYRVFETLVPLRNMIWTQP